MAQWVEAIHVIQLQGGMQIQVSSRISSTRQQQLPSGCSLLLPRSSFTQHQVVFRPLHSTTRMLLITLFKVKTVKKFIRFSGRLPPRLMNQVHNFLTAISHPPMSVPSSSTIHKDAVCAVCLNAQICVKEKVRALHALIKELEFPMFIFDTYVGIPNKVLNCFSH